MTSIFKPLNPNWMFFYYRPGALPRFFVIRLEPNYGCMEAYPATPQ